MKRLLVFVCLLISVASFSQASFGHTTSNPTGLVTNTGSDTMSYTLSKGYDNIAIQPTVTKGTGTVAGVIRFYYSVNGTSWTTLADTLALTNVTTNTAIFIFSNKPAKHWRLITTGSGTMTATTSAKLQTD